MKPPAIPVLTGPQIDPLVPPDADLRHFPDYPINALRLRDSDLASDDDAEAFRLSVLSWVAAWHQVPAGTLPNDLVPLARLLGFGRDTRGLARAVAAGRLRGWFPGTDSRLHHPIVAEVVRRSLAKSRGATMRTEAARTARLAKLSGGRNSLEDHETNHLSQTDDRQCDNGPHNVCRDASTLSVEGHERKGKEIESPFSPPKPADADPASPPPGRKRRAPSDPPEPLTFAAFWQAYPRHDARKAAVRAYADATRRTDPDTIRRGAERYAAWARAKGKSADELAHAATWLNGERWTDGTLVEAKPAANASSASPTAEPDHPLWPKLRSRIPAVDFRTWIAPLRELERDDREITFAAPTRFAADYARSNFAVALEAALSPLRVRIVALAAPAEA